MGSKSTLEDVRTCLWLSKLHAWTYLVRRDLLAHEVFMVVSDHAGGRNGWRAWRDRAFNPEDPPQGGGGLPANQDPREAHKWAEIWAKWLNYRGDPGEVPPPPWGGP